MEVAPLNGNGYIWNMKFYHFEGWPDGKVPEGKSLDDLKLLIDKAAEKVKNFNGSPKIVVHCHAGLGRTGTTLSFI